MNHDNTSDNAGEHTDLAADEPTGVIIAGSEAHKIEGKANRSEADPEQPGTRTEGAEREKTGTIVAGKEAHEIEDTVQPS